MNIPILYEDNHILVVNKPANIPVQLDDSQDQDMISLLKQYLKDKYNKPGNVYCGLVHRLDRPVSGVMVFAKTSKAASRLSNQVRLNQLDKQYTAIVEGKVELGVWEDYLVKDEKTNTSKVTTKNKGKYCKLEIVGSQSIADNKSLITINLFTGRSHQIRVQCSSRNHPIVNDHRYHPSPQKNQQIKLLASQLSFNHPTTKERLTFSVELPSWF